MNINVRQYAEWRKNRMEDYERAYSDWLNNYVDDQPRKPDWSLQAYVDEMIEGMPKGLH